MDVAGRAGRAEVAPQGPHTPDLRGADRAGQLGQSPDRALLHAMVGDPCSQAAVAPLPQLVDPAQRDDVFGPADPKVDFHHQVGSPGQQGGARSRRQGPQGVLETTGML